MTYVDNHDWVVVSPCAARGNDTVESGVFPPPDPTDRYIAVQHNGITYWLRACDYERWFT